MHKPTRITECWTNHTILKQYPQKHTILNTTCRHMILHKGKHLHLHDEHLLNWSSVVRPSISNHGHGRSLQPMRCDCTRSGEHTVLKCSEKGTDQLTMFRLCKHPLPYPPTDPLNHLHVHWLIQSASQQTIMSLVCGYIQPLTHLKWPEMGSRKG